jgi:PKD repeat protein
MHRKYSIGTLVLALVVSLLTMLPSSPASAVATSLLDTTDFSDADVSLVGNASVIDRQLRLTNAGSREVGGAWATKRLDASHSFSTTFTASLYGGNLIGDGVAFVVQSSANGVDAAVASGGGLGYGTITGSGGIAPSIAVEFDTWQNGEFRSPTEFNANHVGIALDGNNGTNVVAKDPGFRMFGAPFNVWIEYDAPSNLFSVFAGRTATKPLTAIVSTTVDLGAKLGNVALAGITGSTGTASSTQEISTWSLTGEPAPQADLRALEINQVVQDWRNNVPLVAGKPTVVRAFVESDSPSIRAQALRPVLHVRRAGSEIALVPLPGSATTAVTPDQAVAERGAQGTSFNFDVPRQWLKDDVTFQVEFRGSVGVKCQFTPGVDSTCSTTKTFHTVPVMSVRTVPVPREGFALPSIDDQMEQVQRMRDVSPMTDFTFESRSWNRKPFAQTKGVGDINSALIDELYPSICLGSKCLPFGDYPEAQSLTATRTFAMIPGGIIGDDRTLGVAGAGDPNLITGFIQGSSRNMAGHEALHTFGVPHDIAQERGACGEDAGYQPNARFWKRNDNPSLTARAQNGNHGTTYPDDARIPVMGPLSEHRTGSESWRALNNAEIWGINPRSMQPNPAAAIIDPYKTFSLMSYCRGALPQEFWPSVSNYTKAGAFFGLPVPSDSLWPAESDGVSASTSRAAALVAPVAAAPAVPVVRAGGSVNGASGVLSRVQRLDSYSPTVSNTGRYRVELLNGSGVVISSVHIDPVSQGLDGDGSHTAFDVALADPQRSGREVRLMDGTQQLARIAASANAPVVSSVLVTGAGDSATPVRVAWQASDRDGNTLKYDVWYLRNTGATPVLLAGGLDTTSVTIGRSQLAASASGAFIVRASDGFWDATAEKTGVVVADAAPEIHINTAILPATVSGDATIPLEAFTYDAEDGRPANVVWTRDDNVVIGNGANVDIFASSMTPGLHVLKATVTDSTGKTAIATREITVVRLPGQAPTAGFGFAETVQGQTVEVTAPVLNPGGQSVALRVIGTPANGRVARIDGSTFTYVPNPDFVGTEKFFYTAVAASGASSTGSVTISVYPGENPPDPNVAPTAVFTATPVSGIAPLTVKLDASGSGDTDGRIESYSWNFGDGTTGSGVAPTHIFTTPGTYIVALTVIDDDGEAGTTTVSVNVAAPPVVDDKCFGKAPTIKGTSGSDRLVGTEGDDVIAGFAGDDVIDGKGGNDYICGSLGNDTIDGNRGNDTIDGGDGNDTLNGSYDNDQLTGGADDDRLDGGSGTDKVSGNDGNDWINGGFDNDQLSGGAGNDEMLGGPGTDVLNGDAGNDKLDGQGDNDQLFGGDGDDSLAGAAGNDVLRGDAGSNSLNGGPDTDTCSRNSVVALSCEITN